MIMTEEAVIINYSWTNNTSNFKSKSKYLFLKNLEKMNKFHIFFQVDFFRHTRQQCAWRAGYPWA